MTEETGMMSGKQCQFGFCTDEATRYRDMPRGELQAFCQKHSDWLYSEELVKEVWAKEASWGLLPGSDPELDSWVEATFSD